MVAGIMHERAPSAPGGSYLLHAPRQLDHSVLRLLVTLNSDAAWHGATVFLVCRDWDTVLSACSLAPNLRLFVRALRHPLRLARPSGRQCSCCWLPVMRV